jgi:hypothetical protein
LALLYTILENSVLQKRKQGEVLTRFCVKHVFIENSALYIVYSKSWFAQKIAALLRELKLPEYPQGPANIPVTTPSNQVNIVSEPDVQQKTVKAAVMRNCWR